MTEPSPPLSTLTAALYTHADVAGMVQILTTTLAGLLPAELVTVERRRSVAERLSGRPGAPIALDVELGDRRLSLRTRSDGGPDASVSHIVQGVRLSTTRVTLDEWIARLAAGLERLAAEDERARRALERFLLD